MPIDALPVRTAILTNLLIQLTPGNVANATTTSSHAVSLSFVFIREYVASLHLSAP